MKSIIVELWKNGELPIKNALYFADGRAGLIDIIFYPYPYPKLLKLGDFDFNDFYEKNKNETTTIDIVKKIQLSDVGYLCIGEGSYGSEGFIACLDSKEDLIWVVYFENSNPFVSATILGDLTVVIESSAGFRLKIDTKKPERMEVI